MESIPVTPNPQRPFPGLANLVDHLPSSDGPALAGPPSAARSQLARELHDGVGQSLFTLLIEIRVALDRGQAGRADLLLLEREARNALQSVRAVAYRIRRGTPDDALRGARAYGERVARATGRAFRWIDARDHTRLAPRVARALAWSIREAITNAIRHGAARNVDVRLVESGSRITVTVRDDGAGFAPLPVEPSLEAWGLGLLSSSERMAEVGGVYSIRSRPGEGTVVSLEVPRYLKPAISSHRLPAAQLTLDAVEDRERASA